MRRLKKILAERDPATPNLDDCNGDIGTGGDGCETNLQTSAAHCGACTHACPSGASCVDGACHCGEDNQCGTDGKCTQSTGLCSCNGNACVWGEQCKTSTTCGCNGGADCSAGELCCPSGCANIQNDAKNCGGCGKDCGAGKCVNGNCQ